MRPEMCICTKDHQQCAKCNKKYRAAPCTVCRGTVSIAKCSTCQLGYCSAKCKKEARKHTCKVKPPTHDMVENQFIGGHTIADMLQPDTRTIVVSGVPVASLTNEVFKFIYGEQTTNLRLIKSTSGLHPSMSDNDVQTVCTDAIRLFHHHIAAAVPPNVNTGALLLECKSYIDFAHKIIGGCKPRWCVDGELVGGGPLIEGPNKDWILQSRAEGYIILRVCIQHPDKFNEAGYAQWSYNACFLVNC
jgi:hypothetical protein